jgi:hypothetical protein
LLKRCIRGDVPHAGRVQDLLARFRPWSDRISVHKTGLLLVDCRRIIVPKESRSSILKAIHQAHPGLQRSLSLARRHYVWPGMRSDIAQTVSDCDNVRRFARPSQSKLRSSTAVRPALWKLSVRTSASQKVATFCGGRPLLRLPMGGQTDLQDHRSSHSHHGEVVQRVWLATKAGE